MNYNFDEIIDRNGTDSVKWDAVQGLSLIHISEPTRRS